MSAAAGLSVADRAILEEYAIRSARVNFSQYCELTYRGLWQPTRYTDLICAVLEKVERGEIRKVILTMPPQHGKSMTVTETFPSWYVGKDPTRSVIEISYNDDYARKFGGSNLAKVKDFGKRLFGIEVSPKRASDTNWMVKGHRGGMISAGVLGGITGAGADLLLLDDPIKNAEEANSTVYRDKIWNEWQLTFRSRVHADGVIIVILTRWHEDDLIGRILSSPEADEWMVIRLPAEAEENDPLGRAIGDPLWPEAGYGKGWMTAQKIAVGPYAWTSLYQGRPTPVKGEIIKREWWRFYDELPAKYDEITQDWDLSLKGNANSSRVCGQVWMDAGANSYLVDIVADIMDFPTTLQAMRTLSEKWPEAGKKYVEDKANGPAAIAILKNEIPGLIEYPPHGDKVTRAKAVTGFIQAGNVYLPNPKTHPEMATEVHDFIQECSSFPRGRYNDKVDVMSQKLSRRLMKKPKRERYFHSAGGRR